MRSDAAHVTGYIDQQPAEWQPTLRRLRDACLVGLDGRKGCVRDRRPDQVDWSVVDDLLSGTASGPEAPY